MLSMSILKITKTAAKALGISRQMFHAILAGRKLSVAMCVKVAKMVGGSPKTWMRLQASYDLKRAAQDKKGTLQEREIYVR